MDFGEIRVREPFWERLGRLWERRGVEPGRRGYWSAWVMRFGKFLGRKRYDEASLADVEAFYRELVGEGRAHGQVEQADAALGVRYE